MSKIWGTCQFENYQKILIPQKGLDYERKAYTINTGANQIIKSALNKLILVEKNQKRKSDLHSILRDFDGIDVYYSDPNLMDDIAKTHYSSNPFYPLVLQYAIIILRDLKLNFQNGELSWYAFLEDSNALFEKYTLKVLQRKLTERVTKWDKPKKYATIRFGNNDGDKYFSPDIIVDYDKSKNSSRAVFDVKNKEFKPEKATISDLVSPADIYQTIFYCKRLKTKVGGLIYPSSKSFNPMPLMIDDENELNLFILSLNMSKNFEERNEELSQQIKKILAYS